MDLASVFDWFAQESGRAAEQANEPMQREMFLRLALMVGRRCATVPQRSN